jgi:hypothetical protein
MEIKKTILAGLCIGAIGAAFAQQPVPFDRTGTLRTQANLAGGYLFAQKDYAAYITGDFDLYVSPRVSITGEGWYSFALNSDGMGLRQNHSLFAGMNYHILRNEKWDPYVGFSPGAAFVSAGYDDQGTLRETKIHAAPLVSITAGCNWYIGSIFNIFLKMRFTSGQVMGEMPGVTRLEELKITGGLGWNFRCWKPKKKA